jgi:hypothetical protein
MSFQVFAEFEVLFGDSILSDVRQRKHGQESAEDAKGTGDKERILPSSSRIRRVVLDNGKDVVANERTDLAECRGDTVILSSDAGRAGFRGK